MSDLDYEAQYNNRRRVPEHVDITARWAAASHDYRGKAGARLDLAYGPGERHRYDLFPAAAAAAPVLVYIHGGYWQRGDRRDFAFVARELNAAGLTVVLPSYSLCPAVGVMDIVGELATFLAALWQQERIHPLLVGHSAGGHLTAALLASDWSATNGVPRDLVRAGYAISGVFDLPPLVGTSLNEALRLTPRGGAGGQPNVLAAAGKRARLCGRRGGPRKRGVPAPEPGHGAHVAPGWRQRRGCGGAGDQPFHHRRCPDPAQQRDVQIGGFPCPEHRPLTAGGSGGPDQAVVKLQDGDHEADAVLRRLAENRDVVGHLRHDLPDHLAHSNFRSASCLRAMACILPFSARQLI